MPVLPASVRLALWATLSWQGDLSADKVLARALPDVDHVAGDLGRLALWHDLGERALFVALPRPGDTTRVPHAAPSALAHAVEAGECVFVASLGGLLVPTLTEYGSAGDVGFRVDWSAYDAEPVPRHRLEMLDLGEVERTLMASLALHAAQFETLGGSPWDARHRESAEGAVQRNVWGLPSQTPARAVRVITSAARVAALVDAALADGAAVRGPVGVTDTQQREQLLRSLSADADIALGEATNVAVMALAGWRPA